MYVMKNMTAELNALPLGIFDAVFVQLLEGYKKCVGSLGR
jgi:hypothetical protein